MRLRIIFQLAKQSMVERYARLRVDFVDELSNKMVKNLVPFYESIDDNIASSSELDEFLHTGKITSPQNVQIHRFIAESAGLSDLKRSIIAYQTKYNQIEAHEKASQAIEHEYRRLCELFVAVLSNPVVKEITGFYDDIPNRISTSREMMMSLRTEGLISKHKIELLKDIASTAKVKKLADAVREYTTKFAKEIAAEKEKQELCKETANLEIRGDDAVPQDASGHPNMFNVPRKSLEYIERDVQEKLEELVEAPSSKEAETEFYAIVGEQGTGKTQISQNYCHKFRGKFELVRFISGDGPAVFRNEMEKFMTDFSISYEKLGYDAGLKQLNKRMTEIGNFLILVDNFEGMGVLDILNVYPSTGGVILVTCIGTSILKNELGLQMQPFSETEILAYFKKVFDVDDIDEKTILEIGKILGYNPHALSVCARYMNEECCDSDDPKKDIEDNMHALINELKNKVRKISVKKMYERSLNKVKEKGADVWNLLCKISILNPNGVSKELVRDVLLGPGSSSSLRKCIGTIKRYGLVQGSEDYVMHRLMQSVIQDTMREDERVFKMVLEETIENLYNGWDVDFRYLIDKWPIFNEIGENAEYLWKYVDKTIDIDKRGMLLSVNSGYLEYYLLVKGELVPTISKFQDLNPKHEPGMLERYKVNYVIIKGLVHTWYNMFKEAMEHYKSMIASIDDQDHLDKGRLYKELGVVYRGKNDYKSALDMFSTSIEQFKLHYGGSEVNHWVADVNISIGSCYTEKGEYDKAIEYFNNVLKIEQQLSKLEGGTKGAKVTPLVASAHGNIGVCYQQQDETAKALEQYHSSLGIFQSVCKRGGEHFHFDIAHNYNNIAAIHYEQGNFAEAKANYEKAFEIFKRLMGEDHSKTRKASKWIRNCSNELH